MSQHEEEAILSEGYLQSNNKAQDESVAHIAPSNSMQTTGLISAEQPATVKNDTLPIKTAQLQSELTVKKKELSKPESPSERKLPPSERKEVKTHSSTMAVLLLSHFTAFSLAIAFFIFVGQDRFRLYSSSGIKEARYWYTPSKSWYEVALCFGPRMPTGALIENVNFGGQRPMPIDDVVSYHRVFSTQFQWSEASVSNVMSAPVSAVSKLLSHIVHDVGRSNTLTQYSDIPFLFHYSICRNFSFSLIEDKHKTANDAGNKGPDSNPDRKYVSHDFVISHKIRDQLLDGVGASYVDVYVYASGEFGEFPLVRDLVPYRTDFRERLLLRVNVERTDRVSHRLQRCRESAGGEPSGTQVNCLTWCLARGLISHVPCTMPWMDALVFNMTAVQMKKDAEEVASKSTDADRAAESTTQRLEPSASTLYTSETAHPWMIGHVVHRRPCQTAEMFKIAFDTFISIYIPEPSMPMHEVTTECLEECPHNCRDYRVRLVSTGTYMRTDSHNAAELGILVPVAMPASQQTWRYSNKALLLDIAALSLAAFGFTLLGIHDKLFAAVDWYLRQFGIVQEGQHPLHFEGLEVPSEDEVAQDGGSVVSIRESSTHDKVNPEVVEGSNATPAV